MNTYGRSGQNIGGYIIAHEDFAERFNYIHKQTKLRSNIKFKCVGVVGARALKQRPNCGDTTTLSDGQIGCALSHLRAYQTMVDQNIRHAVVVEDDAALPSNFDEIVSSIAHELREGEIISLHSPTMQSQDFSSEGSVWVANAELLTPFEAKSVRSTLCYVIDIEAARRILDFNQPVKFVADNFDAFWLNGCFKYVRITSPSLVLVEPFKSTIGYLDPGSFKHLVSSVLNRLPLSKQILRNRRRKLRLVREANHNRVSAVSPLAAGNPNYED
ncbi:glycosyltransferase family 25 protein [Sulfitobacter sp. JB4-11]|uniref:glycosyltransferase family 25 protein n=1 Tax=Sulfitobacter rhodophyticola TaxID=3238304 RepID=UPI003513A007